MKKYKLIKTYPGSPLVNTEIQLFKSTRNIEYWGYYKQKEPIEIINSIDYNPSDHPEYWQEIVEKEYEILSFKQINGVKDLWLETKKGSNQWSRGGEYTWPYTTSEILTHELYQIHSVKRLSDGEVFTVGDKIKGFVEDNNPFTITSIFTTSYHEKEELVFTNYPKNTSPKNGRSCYIPTAIKAKQPLFTTVDSVDVYENDKIYILVIDADTGLFTGDISSSTANENYGGSRYPSVQERSFSTKEAAEEYILLNTYCLSINDILNLRDGLMFIEKELKELVKSKLK